MGRNKGAITIPISALKNAEAEGDDFSHAPIFEDVASDDLSRVSVSRLEPVEEGFLGNVAPTVTEAEIKNRWGGGKYHLKGHTASGAYVKRASRTLSVSGDPIFESAAAEKRWKKQSGLSDDKANDNHGGPAPMSFAEAMALADRKAEQARADADANHKREIERLRLEGELREKERKADEERRERERREDVDRRDKERQLENERREKDARDRDERQRKENDEARARDREHAALMLQIVQSSNKSGDSTKALLTGMEIMQKLNTGAGGGEDGSPLTALISQLPMIIENGKSLIAAGGATPPAVVRPALANPAAPAPPADPNAVTLEGELGKKAMAAAEHIKALGADPEQAFAKLFDHLLTMRPQAAPPAAPTPTPTPPPPAAPPAAAAEGTPSKATTRKKSATTKR